MKKKKIVLLSISGAVIVAAALGGIYIARHMNKTPVKVYSYSELGQGYWGDSLSMSGMITTDVSQNIYVESERTVGQVVVAEGQQVKEGDVLFTYDTELDSLNLETEQLNRQSMELKKQGYENAIKDLQNGKSTSVSWNSNQKYSLKFLSAESDSQDQETEPVKEDAYDYLDFMSQPFLGSGTEEDPYRFLVTEDVVLTGAFWNKEAGYNNPAGQGDRENPVWFCLEVHQKGTLDGAVMRKTISIDGSTLEPRAMEETSYAEWIPTEAISELGIETVPYSGDGTQGKPYRFVVYSETKISGEFLESMKSYYFLLELRENNNSSGNIISSFYKNGSTLGDINSEQKYQIDFEKGIITPIAEEPEEPDEPEEPEEPYYDDSYDFDSDGMISGEVPSEGMTAEEKKAAIEKKQREIKSLELDMKESDLKIQKLQKKIDSATVTSTLNGVVEKLKDSNDVTAGEVFISISNSGGLYVRGTISELMLDQVSVGQEVTGYTYESGVSFTANIKEISEYPDTSQESQNGTVESNYPFMAKISEESTGMKSQEYAELQMTVEEDSTGMYIPAAFVRKENGESYIFKSEDGTLKKQNVTTGKTVWGSLIEVKEGISSEDFIAFPYGKNVKEGAKTEEASIDELYQ